MQLGFEASMVTCNFMYEEERIASFHLFVTELPAVNRGCESRDQATLLAN